MCGCVSKRARLLQCSLAARLFERSNEKVRRQRWAKVKQRLRQQPHTPSVCTSTLWAKSDSTHLELNLCCKRCKKVQLIPALTIKDPCIGAAWRVLTRSRNTISTQYLHHPFEELGLSWLRLTLPFELSALLGLDARRGAMRLLMGSSGFSHIKSLSNDNLHSELRVIPSRRPCAARSRTAPTARMLHVGG